MRKKRKTQAMTLEDLNKVAIAFIITGIMCANPNITLGQLLKKLKLTNPQQYKLIKKGIRNKR